MTDLQRRRELAKLTKPQLIDLLIHAEQLLAGRINEPDFTVTLDDGAVIEYEITS